jgi:phage terminase small subunit
VSAEDDEPLYVPDDLAGEPDLVADVPCPLELIGEPYESQWREAVRLLKAEKRWRVTHAPLVKSMIEARRQADELKETARGEPVVIGSTGNMVRNPLFQIIMDHERLAAALAKMLGLPPLPTMPAAQGEKDDVPKDEFAELDNVIAMQRQTQGKGAGRGGAKGGRKRKPPGAAAG